MSSYSSETVLSVHHWDNNVFSFRCTRDPSLRFENGQFVMVGLKVDERPLLRAYSIASPNWEEYLEFLSIKVPNGPLTSRLQHIGIGDQVLVGRKPVGTLVLRDLKPGKRLYLLATGTGLAPFMSLVMDPAVYELFEKIILVHGVRFKSELAYREFIENDLREHEFFKDMVREKLVYYPSVTRESFHTEGRVTSLLESGRMQVDLGLPALDPEHDRVMICGSLDMLKDLSDILDARGFQVSPHSGEPGDYVMERAFVPG